MGTVLPDPPLPAADADADADSGHGRRRHGWKYGLRLGLRETASIPTLVLVASYIGFGSLVRESGWTLPMGLACTALGWALPGQIALVEMYAVGASLLVMALAVNLANVRLMPMVITLLPMLRGRRFPRWLWYPLAHFIAMTTWAVSLRRCPELSPPDRLPFFIAFALSLWLITLSSTAAGFLLTGQLPHVVAQGLVFLNPLYFLLLFAGDARERIRVLSLVCGAVLGPLLHLLSPDWGLMATGVIGGSLAFAGDRLWERRSHG